MEAKRFTGTVETNILSLSEVLDWDEIDPRKDYSYDVIICAGASPRAEAIYAELFHFHSGPET